MKLFILQLFSMICASVIITGCFDDSDIMSETTQKKVFITSKEIIKSEIKLFNLVNNYRIASNLPALQWNSHIAEVCRNHSKNMAHGQAYISHDGFQQRLIEINMKLPIVEGAENVAFNSGFDNPLDIAFENWLDSPDHYINIIGQFSYSGIGIAIGDDGAYYFTQIFIKE